MKIATLAESARPKRTRQALDFAPTAPRRRVPTDVGAIPVVIPEIEILGLLYFESLRLTAFWQFDRAFGHRPCVM
jgi:hypothetical protein